MEVRLFNPAAPPDYATPGWYATRERAPHLEQNPHTARLRTAAEYVRFAVEHTPDCVVDCGAGDGGLLSLLTDLDVPCYGYDLQPSNIEGAAERGVNVALRDVVTDGVGPVDRDAVAVCTEVLEHLIDPHRFLRDLPTDWVVASSPWNETADSHYEFHLWAWDHDGYRALLAQAGYETVFHESNGDGFQIILGLRP